MNPLSYALLSFVIVGCVAYLAGSFLLRWSFPLRGERVGSPTPMAWPSSILRWEERDTPRWKHTLERLSRPFVPRDKAKLSRFRQRLAWAGYHNPRAIRYFIGAKIGLAILCGYAYPLYGLAIHRVLPNLVLYSVILALLGLFLPDLWLRNRIQARQREIDHALPDVLDLLMVCVEAGMGFDAAVVRVAEDPEKRKSPLHQEMLRMHLEVRAGRPREEALHALGERTGVGEVKAVVGAFVQTERLGTSLGKTLRVHAEASRVKRRHRAEERAHLAPLKMIFPTVFFIFPAFFVVSMAPAVLALLDLLKGMGR